MTNRQSTALTALLLVVAGWTTIAAFSPAAQSPRPAFLASRSRFQQRPLPLGGGSSSTSLACRSKGGNCHNHHSHDDNDEKHGNKNAQSSTPAMSKKQLVYQRIFDTATAAGYPDTRTAGLFGKIKKAHNPITYLILSALAGMRWNWCFRSPYYWFAVGFCIKWYRARYVFKIPVWDRQPNWNNIITSKEQEKDLKAFTCKNCGSTLFIAKTREFFFEGDTGIGGLGCFSCGAKGKDNFIMDRDRIVEDVADVDDYFEYERPLDFVSRAERRKVLKEAAGDEEKANQLLVDRANAESGIVDAEIVAAPDDAAAGEEEATKEEEIQDAAPEQAEEAVVQEEEEEAAEEPQHQPEAAASSSSPEPKAKPVEPKKEAPKKKKFQPPPPQPPVSDDDLDILDMDI